MGGKKKPPEKAWEKTMKVLIPTNNRWRWWLIVRGMRKKVVGKPRKGGKKKVRYLSHSNPQVCGKSGKKGMPPEREILVA